MLLSKLIVFLISPLTLAMLLLCLGLFCLLKGKRRFAAFFISFTLLWLYFWSLPVISHYLSMHMTDKYPYRAPETFPKAEAIVVLGGGVKPANTIYSRPDIKNSADRVWFASQLFHAEKAPLIVLSGGVIPDGSLYSEAEAMWILMLALGVPDSAMITEGQSLNTQQNAKFSYALLHKQGIHRILLVSSALHMQRAETEFRHQGFNVTPAATDYNLEPLMGLKPYLPDTSALLDNTSAIKELAGQFFLRLKYA